MGTNMYPSSSLLSDNNNEGVSVDELIEKADGFAGVFPGITLLTCKTTLYEDHLSAGI